MSSIHVKCKINIGYSLASVSISPTKVIRLGCKIIGYIKGNGAEVKTQVSEKAYTLYTHHSKKILSTSTILLTAFFPALTLYVGEKDMV